VQCGLGCELFTASAYVRNIRADKHQKMPVSGLAQEKSHGAYKSRDQQESSTEMASQRDQKKALLRH